MNKPLERTIRKFNPGTFQTDEEVIRQFVVRKREFGIAMEVLRENIGAPSCQHVLLVGPRGRGKTMLLARAAAEIRTDDALARRLLPVRFMEESHEIFDAADFWLEALFYLAGEIANSHPDIARDLRTTHADLASQWRGREFEERALVAVLETADRLEKQLVLMVENLQDLCSDVDSHFGWKLRKVLQTEPQIVLLATATSRFEGLDDVEQPFFELFRIVGLERLDTEECQCLWQMVSGDAVSTRTIRPLQILTGGNPRLLVIVAEFARHRSLRQLMEELVTLIDDHTEYFRAHLQGFAKTERRVYLAVIDLWQPSSTSEIAARSRMEIRKVSTLLGRLVNRGAVIVEGNSRKRQYSAAERLYSIYYKLRRERDEAAVVRDLIHFMAVFYTSDELAEMSGKLIAEAAQSPAIREGIERAIVELPQIEHFFFGMRRAGIELESKRAATLDDGEAQRLADEIAIAFDEGDFEKVIEGANDSFASQSAVALWDEVIKRFGNSTAPELQERVAKALVNKGIVCGERGDFETEIALYDELVKRFDDSTTPELQEWVAHALFNKGIVCGERGDFETEIALYDELVKRFDDSTTPELQEWVAKALVNKGIVCGEQGDFETEIALYDELVKRFGDSDRPELQERVAKALVNKGIVCGERGDFETEIALYDELVKRFGDSDRPELQERVAKALVNKGIVCGERGDFETEIALYDELVKRFGDSDRPELQEQVAQALFVKGLACGERGDFEAEIALYDELVKRFGDSTAPELQERVAKALFVKGLACGERGDFEAAVALYDEVVKRFGDSDRPELQERVAKALFVKGLACGERGDFEAAVALYDEVVKRFGDSDRPELQEWVASALFNKGLACGERGDFEAAVALYDEVVKRFGDSDRPELQERVAKALFVKGIACGKQGDFEAAVTLWDEVIKRFGDSDRPELQEWVASALFNKGIACWQRGDFETEIALYDEVVKRFGDSDRPELQEQVASALFNKGIECGERGDFEAAVALYDEVLKRFGNSTAPELQEVIASALSFKGETQIQLGLGEEALNMSDELERRFGGLIGDDEVAFKWRARWMRTKALLVQEKRPAAMDAFRSMYAAFAPGNETMMREMMGRVINLIASGTSERNLVEILAEDTEKAATLVPLIIALRQRTGEAVRAPAEVLEVAADIREQIEEEVNG